MGKRSSGGPYCFFEMRRAESPEVPGPHARESGPSLLEIGKRRRDLAASPAFFVVVLLPPLNPSPPRDLCPSSSHAVTHKHKKQRTTIACVPLRRRISREREYERKRDLRLVFQDPARQKPFPFSEEEQPLPSFFFPFTLCCRARALFSSPQKNTHTKPF